MVRNAMLRLCCTFAGFQRSLSPMTPRQPTSAPPSYRRTHRTSVRAATRTSKWNRIRLTVCCHSRVRTCRATRGHTCCTRHSKERSPTAHALRRIVRMFSHRAVTHLSWQERNGRMHCRFRYWCPAREIIAESLTRGGHAGHVSCPIGEQPAERLRAEQPVCIRAQWAPADSDLFTTSVLADLS